MFISQTRSDNCGFGEKLFEKLFAAVTFIPAVIVTFHIYLFFNLILIAAVLGDTRRQQYDINFDVSVSMSSCVVYCVTMCQSIIFFACANKELAVFQFNNS